MKINLLREDQMEKVPHQDAEKNVLHFDDTFSGGSDDFYFQPPAAASEEYKRPRRPRIFLFILLLLLFFLVGAFLSNPKGSRAFFVNIGSNVSMLWNKAGTKINALLHRGREADISGQIILPEKKTETVDKSPIAEAPKPAAEAKPPATPKPAAPKRQTVTVEKKVIKEVLKESFEEKILDSPPIYEQIRDELALGKRNIKAAEFIWSNLARGMLVDRLDISEDRMNIALLSRNPMLLQTYANLMGQEELFNSFLSEETELQGELNRIQMSAGLSSWDKADRPLRIWDLDVKYFNDYLMLAAQGSDVKTKINLLASDTLENSILRHEVSLSVQGSSSASMSVFLQELNRVPAAFVIRDVNSVYDGKEEENLMLLSLIYYERK